jgi:hypothetical protein
MEAVAIPYAQRRSCAIAEACEVIIPTLNHD